ncbi:MAG: hypothetical protein KBT75_15585, partial [Oleispira antarctica]|nr:hypothetical protein [Oleispira antarctica]MBQ0793710.1 hypothetical protein [Oleispira antarctica]
STSSPALSADGRSLTITTLAAIAPNQIFSIYLSKVDFLDIANNALEAQAGTPVFLGEDTPAYDTFASGVTSAGSVKLQLQTFSDPITSAGQVVGLAQITNDGGTSDFEILQSLNATFEDVDSGSLRAGDTDIEQLNEPEAQTRIQALAAATYADAGIASPPTAVAVDVARVQFSIDGTTESSTYELVLTNEFGVAKALTVDVSSVVGTVAVGTNGTTKVTLELVDGFTGVADLLLQSVEPGETITISSLTDFGSIDGESSITLTDRIAPTTIIQNSYGQGKDTSAVVGSNYGNGGELSEITAATIGAPLLNITPRLLTPQAGETVSTGVSLPIASTWVALQDKMQDEDEDDNADVDIATDVAAGYTGYDATAFTAWSVGARTMGIAVSEDVTLAGTPLVSGAQVLTGWTAQNDVVLNDKGLAVTADLINFSVPNIIDFANLDHGKTIDFSGVISDESGNTAVVANNPVVVVRDLMPPLLTNAVYNGENIVLTYNENIVVPDNSTITLDGTGNGNDLSFNVDSTNIEVAAKTLTIKRAAFGNLDSELYFNRGLFDHDDDINTVDRAHGLIITEDTEDAREVSWANWDGGAGLVPIPGIAIRDDAGTFELSVAPTTTGLTNTSTSFTVKYRFSHRIDLFTSGLTANSGATTLTGGEISNKFTLTSGTTIDTGSSSADLDDTGRVLTVTVSTAGGIASSDTFGLTAGTIASEWDSNDSLITVLTDVTVP